MKLAIRAFEQLLWLLVDVQFTGSQHCCVQPEATGTKFILAKDLWCRTASELEVLPGRTCLLSDASACCEGIDKLRNGMMMQTFLLMRCVQSKSGLDAFHPKPPASENSSEKADLSMPKTNVSVEQRFDYAQTLIASIRSVL